MFISIHFMGMIHSTESTLPNKPGDVNQTVQLDSSAHPKIDDLLITISTCTLFHVPFSTDQKALLGKKVPQRFLGTLVP